MTPTSATGPNLRQDSSASGVVPPRMRRRRMRRSARTRDRLFGYVTLGPVLAVVGLLMGYPFYVAINLSLRGGEITNLERLSDLPLTFDNYIFVLTDPGLLGDIWRSAVYTLGVLLPAFAIGLGLALILNRKFPGRRIIRPLVLLPWAIPGVAVSAAFSWMLDASYGVINFLLRSVGLIETNIAWLANSDTAMTAVIIPTVWKYYPFFTLVLLAALQAIPGEQYEAAQMDGANSRKQFKHVTWPAVRSASALAIIITGIGIFREFDFIFPLTRGGPNEATQTLAIRIYTEAFQYFELGVAAALGVVTMAIAGTVLIAAGKTIRRESA